MKSALTLPIISGIALAAMAGAAASHYHSVDNMVAFAGMTRANGLPSISTGPARLANNEHGTRAIIDELKRQNDSLEQNLANSDSSKPVTLQTNTMPAASSNNNDLQNLLAELVTQNRYLRSQISETNRDLMTLQFQVDSHSTQFRPLSLAEDQVEAPFERDYIGVLPPSDLP